MRTKRVDLRAMATPSILLLVILMTIASFHGHLWAEGQSVNLRNLSLGKDRYFLLTPEVREALEDLNTIIDKDVAMWVASMYDPDTGGFFYARSAIGRPGFSTDIESTSQALGLIRGWGFANTMPDEVREKLITFFQSRQDPATGYFYDPQFGSNVSNAKRSRNLSQSVGALSHLGASPLYPLPYERQGRSVEVQSSQPTVAGVNRPGLPIGMHQVHVGVNHEPAVLGSSVLTSKGQAQEVATTAASSSLPEHLRSAEALRRWMESFDWERNSYSAGHNVSSARSEIIRVGLENTVYEFIESIQNKETGFWGTGRTYNELSGAMKLSVYYSGSTGRPYPYAKKMLESVIYTLENDTPGQIFHVYNPPFLIRSAIINGSIGYDPEIDDMLRTHMPYMIRLAKESLLRFKQPDKSFSYLQQGSSPTSQGARVSLGLPEADMNATAGANGTVSFLFDIVGLPRPNLLSQYAKEFWDAVVNMEPHPTIEIPIGIDEDFEDVEEISMAWSHRWPHMGSYNIVSDPQNPENSVLAITKAQPGDGYSVSTSFETIEDAPKTSISFRFMVSEFTASPAFNIYFGSGSGGGNYALNFVIARSGERYFLSHRTSGRGTGTEIGPIRPNEWYTVDIEYEPRGIHDTTFKVFLDGECCGKVFNEYYNGGDASRPPVRNIKYFEAYGYISATATLYIDDLKVKPVREE